MKFTVVWIVFTFAQYENTLSIKEWEFYTELNFQWEFLIFKNSAYFREQWTARKSIFLLSLSLPDVTLTFDKYVFHFEPKDWCQSSLLFTNNFESQLVTQNRYHFFCKAIIDLN